MSRLARPLPRLLDVEGEELVEPSSKPTMEERARLAAEAFEAVPFEPGNEDSPFDLLLSFAARSQISREADQNPDLAGRNPIYEKHFPAFEPVEIPVDDDLSLTGHRSTGAPGAPVIIVVHGMFDSHTTWYVAEYAELLRRWGFHVVALDMRDHGQLLDKSRTSLGLAEGKDLFQAARVLAQAEGVSVGILGFSFGGACAVRAAYEASQEDEAEILKGGVFSMSAPLNIHEAVAALDDPDQHLPRGNSLKDRLVMRGLNRTFQRHLKLRAKRAGPLDSPIDDFESFIRAVILPSYPNEPGLVGAFLGKARANQEEIMGAIQCPTALLHSVDDPVVLATHMLSAQKAAGENSWVTSRLLPRGGHLGAAYLDPKSILAMLNAWFGTLRDG
ncbi:MAG: alpha/beta hydrolase [Planctomycetota bacterium]|nr:alpha/beta hydrolase [Planctomycetota bacterium]